MKNWPHLMWNKIAARKMCFVLAVIVMSSLVGAVTTPASALAQPVQSVTVSVNRDGVAGSGGATQSLAGMLNLDGTLKLAAGFNGSFDARGYRMIYAPSGAPG